MLIVREQGVTTPFGLYRENPPGRLTGSGPLFYGLVQGTRAVDEGRLPAVKRVMLRMVRVMRGAPVMMTPVATNIFV